MNSLEDEATLFFDTTYQQSVRLPRLVTDAVDSLLEPTYCVKLERFLNSGGQRRGQILLPIQVGGRAHGPAGCSANSLIAVPFPGRAADA